MTSFPGGLAVLVTYFCSLIFAMVGDLPWILL
uniref:Photosystem II 22 kDa proteinic n=1 Tax=Rhizophora mucronata TaxID=61149 RepID=A0A2P2JIY2_RHIMU